MTASEFYTEQFYTWEYRGRGWHVSEYPVDLEPPFIPYYRHGFTTKPIDDGKRHTVWSRFIESIRDTKQQAVSYSSPLDYKTLEPFPVQDDTECIVFQVKFSKHTNVNLEKMKALYIMLSSFPTQLSFEIIGTASETVIQFVCDEDYGDFLETYLHIYFPEIPVLASPVSIDAIIQDDLAISVTDFGLKYEFMRPLQAIPSLDPVWGILGVLERLTGDERAGIQILFQPVGNAWSESIIRSVTMYDGSSFFYDEPEAPKRAIEKVSSPLYGVTIRTFGQHTHLSRAEILLEKVSYAVLKGMKGVYNELIPLPTIEYTAQMRIADIYARRSHRLGMLLNIDELVALAHFPSEQHHFKKLFTADRKTKLVPSIARGKQYILGENTHNGQTQNVSLNTEQRLKHTHIIGATGTGKSTLIAQLLLQDVEQGNGVVLFDPHGDLVDHIIAHLPVGRLHDVVLLDPSDIEFPIGLNILQAFSDTEREVLSSDLVAIFRKYSTSWGDQMNTVLGNAIHAILESKQGGSLHDLRRFLVEKEQRDRVLRAVRDPSILYYWQKEYPLLKSNSIGPILTRLDTFLRPKAIRNMVVQKSGLDFTALLNTKKIILLQLSQGLIGKENSFLLGSLILSKLHQAILQRQAQAVRDPVFIYLDEFQNFVTPSIKEMISGIRKYNTGLILAHQDLQQVQREDGELLHSILGNIYTRIVFRIGEPDAKRLQDGFSGFEHTDLQNLGRGEAVIRIEQPQYDCSLSTIVFPQCDADTNRDVVIAHSRQMYASPKDDVEASLFESLNLAEPESRKEKRKDEKVVVQPDANESHPVQAKTSEVPPVTEHAEVSTHRYLQILVKKMAESNGYIATLEASLPQGVGQVDVLLTKGGKTMAIEICNTTDAEWEAHNIEKCVAAQYDTIVSLSGDMKQLEKIKAKCAALIPEFASTHILFLTPDALFAVLSESIVHEESKPEQTMKGYRVKVSYDQVSQEEMNRKRVSIAQVVMNSLNRKKKK